MPESNVPRSIVEARSPRLQAKQGRAWCSNTHRGDPRPYRPVSHLVDCTWSTASCRLAIGLLAAITWLADTGPRAARAARGRLTLTLIDGETSQQVAARVHLSDSRGKPVKPPAGLPFWHDHFCIDGQVRLELRPGFYRFEIERGPEYLTHSGDFQMEATSGDEKTIELKRFVDMNRQGWWSGDLHIHRPLEEMDLLVRAEDLDVAPVITWWNARGRPRTAARSRAETQTFAGGSLIAAGAGEDEREGGALLYFHLPQPIDFTGAADRFPSGLHFLRQVREGGVPQEKDGRDKQGEQDKHVEQDGSNGRSGGLPAAPVHVDVEKPFWWDVPVWVASGLVDSIGLANNHMHRQGMLDNEAWGRPREKTRFPSPRGNGRWSEAIYYHLLNCGIELPPSAGSASGVLPNPVGYNRVYVHCGPQLDESAWWENLRRGRVVVTNGPLLIPSVDGELPGHTFQANPGERLSLTMSLELWTRDTIDYLELVQNGLVAKEVRLDALRDNQGRLPPLEFDDSGWFLVRAVTNHPKTYRFASSGPYYVRFGDRRRISRDSADFFLQWIDERIEMVSSSAGSPSPPDSAGDRLAEYREARAFWQSLADQANAP